MLLVLEVLAHDVGEELGGACGVIDTVGAVKSCPSRHDSIGRQAAEPAVGVVIGGTGLADDIPAGDARVHSAGVLAVFYIVMEETVHDRRGFGRIRLLGNGVTVVKNDVVLGVGDIVIGVGLVEQTAVAHVGEGGSHLADGDAAVETAQ